MGWASKRNGELLDLAATVFLTVDRNLSFQQDVGRPKLAVVVLVARGNRYSDLQPLVADLLTVSVDVVPGQLVRVGVSRCKSWTDPKQAPCDQIPADLRTVSFPATITSAPDRPPNTLFYVNVRETFPGSMGFGIGVDGNVLAFLIDGPAIVKAVPTSTYLEIEGGSTVSVPSLAPSTVSFPFDGLYDYCVLKSPMPSNHWTTCYILPADLIVKHVECVSKNHQLTLTRC